MNRVARDYCSKGTHPQWRAWMNKGVYAEGGGHGYSHDVRCVFCNARIGDSETRGSFGRAGSFLSSSARWRALSNG